MTNVLDELWSGRTMVLSHRNADIDAMGCSIALAAMFPEVTIGAVESVSRGAQNLLKSYDGQYQVIIDPQVDQESPPYDRIVFVDTATPSQVEPYDRFLSGSIVIDHHVANPALVGVNDRYHCEPTSPSCAQIVHRLAVEAGAEVNADAAMYVRMVRQLAWHSDVPNAAKVVAAIPSDALSADPAAAEELATIWPSSSKK